MHPGRPALDVCPVCDRPRCAADAGDATPGCRACTRAAPSSRVRPPDPAERLVRGTLAALGAAVLGGVVSAQYVGAELFAYLTPFVVGVLCGAAAQAAAGGPRRGTTALRVRGAAALCALLGTGLGLLLEGSRSPVSSAAVVPALLAVAGAVLWTAPPRSGPRRQAATGGRGG